MGLPSLCTLRTRLTVRAVCAVVFLKVLLRKAVERERRNGAFETWSGEAPHALRAAPAGELVAVDPDQAFTHTSLPFAYVWDSSSDATGGTHQQSERGR